MSSEVSTARVHLKWSCRQETDLLELSQHFSAYLVLEEKNGASFCSVACHTANSTHPVLTPYPM